MQDSPTDMPSVISAILAEACKVVLEPMTLDMVVSCAWGSLIGTCDRRASSALLPAENFAGLTADIPKAAGSRIVYLPTTTALGQLCGASWVIAFSVTSNAVRRQLPAQNNAAISFFSQTLNDGDDKRGTNAVSELSSNQDLEIRNSETQTLNSRL